jgi:hypothetical protein
MKKKIIKKTLDAIHKNLCKTITDEKVRELVEDNTIITGGCIPSMLLKEKVNDFDMYFRDKETVLAITNYYINKFKELKKEKAEEGLRVNYCEETGRVKIEIRSQGIASMNSDNKDYQYFEKDPNQAQAEKFVENVFEKLKKDDKNKYQPILLTSNAITLSDKVQLIFRFYGEPEEIHKNYDFVHVTNYWTSWDKEVVTNIEALEHILARELRYIGSLYPLCSMIRLRKFIKRGWTINAGQMIKIAFQINELDLNNPRILEEQLTGVDFAYFAEVIEILRNEGRKDIDATYLAEIIDRVFDK